jgi:hypothetical protein
MKEDDISGEEQAAILTYAESTYGFMDDSNLTTETTDTATQQPEEISLFNKDGSTIRDDLTRAAFKEQVWKGEGGSDFRAAWRAYRDGERDYDTLSPQSTATVDALASNTVDQ